VDEEVVLLEEQVAALQADVEALQNRLADAEALASGRETEVARLQSELSAREAAIAEQAALAEERRLAVAAFEEQRRGATARYRELLLAREPGLPADLVEGESVEEVDASAARARQTVLQVRERLEAETQASRVPAGAPVRGGQDISTLSPAEKIRFGLQQG